MDGPWTLPELVAEAAAALADGRAPRPGGRVRDLPNERTIRWYVTIGLVDPPLSRRGRVALYGPRHLLQLVAIKRRQADGRSLTEIQAELTGATDATLRRIARLGAPDREETPSVLGGEPPPTETAHADRVGSGRPGPDPAGLDRTSPGPAGPCRTGPDRADPGRADPGRTGPGGTGPRSPRFWAERPAPDETDPSEVFVHGVRLAPGATLLLESSPSPGDAAAIIAAAAPLIDLLTERGLL